MYPLGEAELDGKEFFFSFFRGEFFSEGGWEGSFGEGVEVAMNVGDVRGAFPFPVAIG